jgi:hypothetical protein
MNARLAPSISRRNAGLSLVLGLLAVLIAVSWLRADDIVTSRTTSERTFIVDRSSHGSIRHVDTHVVHRTVEVRHDDVPQSVFHVHPDVELDIHFLEPWNDFAVGLHCDAPPPGFLTLRVGDVPYYYSGGIYYQQASGGYVEVYPPVGAVIPQLPGGVMEIYAGSQTYYYAGGAFYVQQPDGAYAIAPAPIGVVVPELPPGATQVSVNGTLAYQFNGICYEPAFVDGVTQYETIKP